MTQITPEVEIALSEDRLLSLTKVVADARKCLEDLRIDAQTGGKIETAKFKKALQDMNSAVVACTNVEQKLDDCRNRQAGIARGGYALDMDKARAEIGCKLDQLRACHYPGEVSE